MISVMVWFLLSVALLVAWFVFDAKQSNKPATAEDIERTKLFAAMSEEERAAKVGSIYRRSFER